MAGELMAAQAAQSEWSGLAGVVGDGRLYMAPGAAEACASACDAAHGQLQAQITAIRRLGRVEGFGAWGSGRQLATKFEQKADGGAGLSGVAVLRAHQEVLIKMAETFRAAARAYPSTDNGFATALGGHG